MGTDLELIEQLAGYLAGVGNRLAELAPALGRNELVDDMFYTELGYAQKLVIELTRRAVGEESKPEENADSVFMPGELNDVIGEKADKKEGGDDT